MLQCPLCHMALLAVEDDGIEVDVCHHCGGAWLDVGELETISNGEAFAPHTEARGELGHLRCPRCDTCRFDTVELEEGPLARCADCLGLFVEAKTIDRIPASVLNARRRRPASQVPVQVVRGLLVLDLFFALFGG